MVTGEPRTTTRGPQSRVWRGSTDQDDQGTFLRRTIESIIAQKYSETELFVMDGGSDDDTIDVIRFPGGPDHRMALCTRTVDKGQQPSTVGDERPEI